MCHPGYTYVSLLFELICSTVTDATDTVVCHLLFVFDLTGPKRSTLQAMLVNLENDDDMPALQTGSHSPPRGNNNSLADIDDTSKGICLNLIHSSYMVILLCGYFLFTYMRRSCRKVNG